MSLALTEGKPRIVVIGSANVDLVVPVRHVPGPGETILGGQLRTNPGGKGANQAVAAARLGGNVAFVGRIGTDEFGGFLRERLAADNVNCQHLLPTPEHRTGVALITVADDGENAITVAPGANANLTISDILDAQDVIANTRVCVVQLEIPLETARFAIELARRLGVETILDPAPAPTTTPTGLLDVDIITPNQTEASQLMRAAPAGASWETTAAALRRHGPDAVVLKLGADGAFVLG
ncbi:MAG: ribokinase, partial [Phycisphaerae bacterium]|nr:ribokinase [Phycisphaerae bacterium]